MMGRLSLAEELRAIRGGANSKSPLRRSPESAENERPWKSDIDRMEQTLREALLTISQLSGVDLPDKNIHSESEENSASRVAFTTLKDRIRNDLEAFSVTAVSEVSKEAEEKARAALTAIKNEVSSQVEQVVGEYREKLKEQVVPQDLQVDISRQSRERIEQLVQAQTDEFARWVWMTCKGTGTPIPAQIEKLLEPYVEEATARVVGGMQQRIQEQIFEQEKLIHERLEQTTSSLHDQLATFEQTAQQICEQNADSVVKISAERLNATAEEASKSLESRIQEQIDSSFAGIQSRLDKTVASMVEEMQEQENERVQAFMRRMEAIASEAEATKTSEVSSRIEQAAAQISETSLQNLGQQARELTENARSEMKSLLQQDTDAVLGQIQEVGRATHESLEQNAARVMDRFSGLEQDLAGMRQRYLGDCQGQLYSMVKDSMGSLEPTLQRIAEERMAEVAADIRKSQDDTVAQFEVKLREVSEGQYRSLIDRLQQEAGNVGSQTMAEIRGASQSALQELSNKVDASAAILREQQAKASSYFESSVSDTLENFRQQLAQITEAEKKEHRKTVVESVTELQNRLRQAADFLAEGLPGSV